MEGRGQTTTDLGYRPGNQEVRGRARNRTRGSDRRPCTPLTGRGALSRFLHWNSFSLWQNEKNSPILLVSQGCGEWLGQVGE